jgi:SpoVK/Ycf46/Vps4 family AAA+-type ATPase
VKFTKELNLLLKARYPILYISSFEEERVEYLIFKRIRENTDRLIYSWNFIDGYKNYLQNPKFAAKNPLQALELIESLKIDTGTIFILKDFHKFLFDISISRKIKNLLKILRTQSKTIIILSSEIEIPKELRDSITNLEFLLPSTNQIKAELLRLENILEKKFEQEFLELLIRSFQSFSIEKIRRILTKSIAKYGGINYKTIRLIYNEKKILIDETKILEFCQPKQNFQDIGGNENLKNWLKYRKEAFSNKAKLYGLPSPRGLLLIGIQGTGKSLTAKAIANEWNIPLLKLDIGKIFAGIIGESESRIREMIKLAEALEPCVLWVDEIDKGFNEQARVGDGGTSTRVFATFITWLSEKTSDVFIIATANNFYSLPLELIRKGRFDEIFFIGLPNKNERKKIFEVIIERFRKYNEKLFDFSNLSNNSVGFSGAEIEQAIIEGMYVAFNEKREFTETDIVIGLNSIIPLSKTHPDKLLENQNLALSGTIRIASQIEKK